MTTRSLKKHWRWCQQRGGPFRRCRPYDGEAPRSCAVAFSAHMTKDMKPSRVEGSFIRAPCYGCSPVVCLYSSGSGCSGSQAQP